MSVDCAVHFCPWCGCILTFKEQPDIRYVCDNCPYIFKIHEPISLHREYCVLKSVDTLLGGAKAWENVDSTEAKCPTCSHPRAYFMQMQTRSADEPMTTFYKCCNRECGYRWRE